MTRDQHSEIAALLTMIRNTAQGIDPLVKLRIHTTDTYWRRETLACAAKLHEKHAKSLTGT